MNLEQIRNADFEDAAVMDYLKNFVHKIAKWNVCFQCPWDAVVEAFSFVSDDEQSYIGIDMSNGFLVEEFPANWFNLDDVVLEDAVRNWVSKW